MSTGARARQLIDDEIARITGASADEVTRLNVEIAQETGRLDALKLDAVVEQRKALQQTYYDMADAMVDPDNAAVLRRLADDIKFDGPDSMFVEDAWMMRMDFVVKGEINNPSFQQFMLDRVFTFTNELADEARVLLANGEPLTQAMIRELSNGVRIANLARMGAKASPETQAAITELADAARELIMRRTALRQATTAARIEATETVLAANRAGFGEGDIATKFAKVSGKTGIASTADVRDALAEYNRRVPREWVDQFDSGYSLAFVQRGFFDRWKKFVRISGPDWRSTLTHELTHGHQFHTKSIQAIERLFLSRRAQQIGDSAFKPQAYMSDAQRWYDLGLNDPYMTKLYASDYTELSTRASEMVWYGLSHNVPTDVLDFWLGVLLLL